jgi:hypothetical protein
MTKEELLQECDQVKERTEQEREELSIDREQLEIALLLALKNSNYPRLEPRGVQGSHIKTKNQAAEKRDMDFTLDYVA